MHLLHDNDPHHLEDGVRAMLHRLAGDMDESRPTWEELVGPYDVRRAVGPSGSAPEVRNRRPPPVRRARRSMVAASVLLLAVAGAVVVDRAGSGTTGGRSTESISAVAPGEASFDAAAAAAVWSTGLDDPEAATTAYLGAMGVPLDAAAPQSVEVRSSTDGTAVVEWSLPGDPGAAGGTVYLRSSSLGGAAPTWTVVGAAAADVALADVAYDGDALSFTVSRTTAGADQLAVGVWVDGRPISLGGDAVARAGDGAVSLGELLDIGAGADAEGTLRLAAEADDIVTLRVVHVVDGTVRSLTQMAVALPEADPEVAAAGPAPVDVAGQVAAEGEAGTAATTGSTGVDGGADAGAGGSGGTELVPGVTLPSLPPLPPLPTMPGLPTPTLPAPPTTAPGSLTDQLP